jgi:hypothetical protein
MPVDGLPAWAFRGHLSAGFAFLMQLLHSGSGKVSLTPRRLSGAHAPNSRVLFWTISCNGGYAIGRIEGGRQ